jgi:hypothetical protein
MSEAAIRREFNGEVTVLDFTIPDNAAPIGLVELEHGALCVIELDEHGCAPLLEDFTSDESEIAYAHYQERVEAASKRCMRAAEEMVEDILGSMASAPKLQPAFID